jgi:hypothetical protein
MNNLLGRSLRSTFNFNEKILILGDALALALVILIGFATHGETDFSFLARFFAIFLPLCLTWFLLAPWFSLFQSEITSSPKQLWRVPLAMLFAAPLAVIVRGYILRTEVVPIFIVALGGMSAVGMMIWRGIYFLINYKDR